MRVVHIPPSLPPPTPALKTATGRKQREDPRSRDRRKQEDRRNERGGGRRRDDDPDAGNVRKVDLTRLEDVPSAVEIAAQQALLLRRGR